MVPPVREGADAAAASACHQKGLERLRGNRADLALPELERAVELAPDNAEFLKNLGNARKATGNLEGAVASYRRSLRVAPDYLPVLYNLGLTLHEMNRLDEAEQHFRRVHELDPRDADALFHLGALLSRRSRFPEAAEKYREALRLAPDNPYLWMHLGMACREVPGEAEDSVRSLRRSIELEPGLAEVHYQLGLTCKRLGRIEEAIGFYRKALELRPDSSEAHNDLGNILQDEGRLEEAVEHYRKAIGLSPGYAVAHNNLGGALIRMQRVDEAIGCFRKAIQLQPDLADAHLNLGSSYSLRGGREQALDCYGTALRLRPDSAPARECLLFEMQQVCDWSRFEELCEQQRRSVAGRPEQPITPFSLLSIPSTPAEQLQCARNFSERQLRAVARDRERLRFRFERKAKPRLRVGYLSADFHEHATACLMAELFELHDHDRFEIAAYSYGPDDGSRMRARLARAFDRFADIAPLSHAEAAELIHSDRVDILVDLKGYTQHARTEIVALRPAPIQVSYLGYPGTMGADFIDYIVADRFVMPHEHAACYTEKPVVLPGSYQVNDRKRTAADTPPRRELGLPEKAFVFCCFNQAYKILPHTFEVWMRLLRAVPDSVLWLLESNPWAAHNLRREMRNRGVEPERLIVAPKLPLDRHLARLRAADLFLDTLPYNAHTTASDALWVGLPVVTCPGATFASRVAGSLLAAVGMPELIAGSMHEYEALAVELARNPEQLLALRERLGRSRLTAPLFDTPAFARNLEAAYLEMWQNDLAGNGPREIRL